ncbi:MAG: beta-propeller domain-containing protein [Candidatus Micrarchaeota archaeon]|nr:beta-propeller domain-containing protein [Candidatus Micrarchaeota archaeon]
MAKIHALHFLLLGIFLMLLFAGCATKSQPANPPQAPASPAMPSKPNAAGLSSFSSWQEVSDFLQAANPQPSIYFGKAAVREASLPESSTGAQQAGSFSQTNVQVAGVDEADIVKNDGKFIYAITNSYLSFPIGPFYRSESRGKVTIIDAYPPSSMRKAGEIEMKGEAKEMLIYKDRLVVFGHEYRSLPNPRTAIPCARCILPPFYSQTFAFMRVFDTSDKSSPKLIKEIEVKGQYLSSRLKGSKVYGIFSDYPDYQDPIPLYLVDGKEKKVAPSDIYYFDYPDSSYSYTHFISLDLDDLGKEEERQILLAGSSQAVYVSHESIYLSSAKYEHYYPEWSAFYQVFGSYLPKEAKDRIAEIDATNYSSWRKDMLKMAQVQQFAEKIDLPAKKLEELQAEYNSKLSELYAKSPQQLERTAISKISLSGFQPLAKGEVPGRVLNQFSMDESGGHFRIATTIQPVWAGSGAPASSSAIYVLDKDMQVVGKVEGIAPGESIFSVRFMGDKAYMVTFRKIDPFFTIDLSEPASPKLLGKLKIPGYSDYLHPYDENYIIGIGKDAVPSKDGDFAWYQGVKLSLFDVRDFENPKEAAKFSIGDRGTESYALQDHKAFLFDRQKNLLVLPITLAEFDRSKYQNGSLPDWAYGDFVFQGAYVFHISPERGFVLEGRITHAEQDEILKSGEYLHSEANVRRSLYMDNYLYTISSKFIKANELGTLAPISSVKIG